MTSKNQIPRAHSSRIAVLALTLASIAFSPARANYCEFMALLGGSGDENITKVLSDSQGNLYVLGSTTSVDFPVANAPQATFGGATDAFLTKIDPSGCNILFSTYIGGSGIDEANAAAFDGNGNLWIAGKTTSPNFPVLSPTYDATCGTDGHCNGGASDAFLVAFDPSGRKVAATFYGGSRDDQATGVVVESSGLVTLVGPTASTDLPLLAPTQRALMGSADAMVARFTTEPSSPTSLTLKLSFSTYHGGRGLERVAAAALTTKGLLVVVGSTQSTDFPAVNPLQKSGLRGTDDAFVAAWSLADRKLVFSSYLGGDRVDYAKSVTAIGTEVVIGGQTWSTDFPQVGATTAPRLGPSDGFVTRMNAGNSVVVYSRLFGGTGADSVESVAVNGLAEVLISGATSSLDLPVTPDAEQPRFAGGSTDSYLARISNSTQEVAYASYLGSTSTDLATANFALPDGSWLMGGRIELEPGPETLGMCDGYYALIEPTAKIRR